MAHVVPGLVEIDGLTIRQIQRGDACDQRVVADDGEASAVDQPGFARGVLVEAEDEVPGADGLLAALAIEADDHYAAGRRTVAEVKGFERANRLVVQVLQETGGELRCRPGAQRGVGVPGAAAGVKVDHRPQVGQRRTAEDVFAGFGVSIRGAKEIGEDGLTGVGHDTPGGCPDGGVGLGIFVVDAEIGLISGGVNNIPDRISGLELVQGVGARGQGLGLEGFGGPVRGHFRWYDAEQVVLDAQHVHGVQQTLGVEVHAHGSAEDVEILARRAGNPGGVLVVHLQPRLGLQGDDLHDVGEIEVPQVLSGGVEQAHGHAALARVVQQAQARAGRQRFGDAGNGPRPPHANDVAVQPVG